MAAERWDDIKEEALKKMGPWESRLLTDHVMQGKEGMGGRPVAMQIRGTLDVETREDVTGEPFVIIHRKPVLDPGEKPELHILESPLGDGASKHVEGTIDDIKRQVDAALRDAGYTLYDE